MNEKADRGLWNVVNASGFPLQMRVRQEIEDHHEKHGWEVVAGEYPWRSSTEDGYVDLILQKRITKLVLDCKRSSAPWVFLLPDNVTSGMLRARCRWAQHVPGKRGGYSIPSGYSDIQFEPRTDEAEFCAIRGSSDRGTNLLERAAGTLVRAVDMIAGAESGFAISATPSFRAIYVPVIVTTADVRVARFPIGEVSLENGKIRTGRFEEVEAIRFRKSLSTIGSASEKPRDMAESKVESERTVYVVTASAIVEFLSSWKLSAFDRWPEMREY